MTPRWMALLVSALLASAASAAPGNTDIVRDLAGRVGPIIGSALACTDIARPRIQAIVDKFSAVIKEASSNEAERDDLTQLLNRSVADGRNVDHQRKTGLPAGGAPACRPRTLDRRTGGGFVRTVAGRRDRTVGGRRGYVDRAGSDRPCGARHHRSRNPVRNCGTVLRPGQGTRPPDEARDRHRLQPGQRRRRRGRPAAAADRGRRRL